jgi:hypothetical protein
LRRTVLSDSIRALALSNELASPWIEPLPERLEVRVLYCSLQTEHCRASPHPPAADTFAFGVIVAVLQVTRRVALSVRHGPNGEHERSARRFRRDLLRRGSVSRSRLVSRGLRRTDPLANNIPTPKATIAVRLSSV